MRFQYAVVAAIPLLLSPALLFALAEGWLDFGGGEKDIILVFPYFIWALVFFLCGVILISKHWPLGQCLKRSAVVSTIFIVVLGVAAYGMSWLGTS